MFSQFSDEAKVYETTSVVSFQSLPTTALASAEALERREGWELEQVLLCHPPRQVAGDQPEPSFPSIYLCDLGKATKHLNIKCLDLDHWRSLLFCGVFSEF
jgi:hypothetical protein